MSASAVAGAPIELQMPSNDLPKDQISITPYGLKWSSISDLETKIQVYRTSDGFCVRVDTNDPAHGAYIRETTEPH